MSVSHTHHDTLHKIAQDKSPGTVLLHLVVILKYLFLRAQKIAVLESTDKQGQGEWQPGLPESRRINSGSRAAVCREKWKKLYKISRKAREAGETLLPAYHLSPTLLSQFSQILK